MCDDQTAQADKLILLQVLLDAINGFVDPLNITRHVAHQRVLAVERGRLLSFVPLGTAREMNRQTGHCTSAALTNIQVPRFLNGDGKRDASRGGTALQTSPVIPGNFPYPLPSTTGLNF